MKQKKKRIIRITAIALVLALFAASVSGAVYAEAVVPDKQITLAMTPSLAASEPLVVGDVLKLDVTAQADFRVYSNFTVIYYDKNHFAPCDAAGVIFTPQTQGGTAITDYIALDPENPLSKAGQAYGDINVTNLANYPAAWKDAAGVLLPAYQGYAAIALKVPYDLTANPATGTPAASNPWFSFYLKPILPTSASNKAAVFMSQSAVRTDTANPNGVMYYSAATGGAGWRKVAVTLPAKLEYSIQAAAVNPVTVTFSAGTHGTLTGGIDSVRNIEQGTLIGEQSGQYWPGVTPDYGYYFAGWAYADDPALTPLPDTEPIGTREGVYTPSISFIPVFLPNPVQLQLYLLDLRKPAGQQEINAGTPIALQVGDDFNAAVQTAQAAAASLTDPVDPSTGYTLTILPASQANNNYVVPLMDQSTLRVEIARIHRGTYFINYLPSGSDVTNLPAKQEKAAGASVSIAAAPKRKGYTFTAWTTGVANYAPGAIYSSDADMTLTAVWQQNPPPFITNGNAIKLQYKSATTLTMSTSAPGVTWSSNSNVVQVNSATGEIKGVKTGTATVTGTDADGFSADVSVKVSYAWWQWLIVIFLFGWIWY